MKKLLIVSVTGLKTTGVVRYDQPRVIDLAARHAQDGYPANTHHGRSAGESRPAF
jgi:hypothetical protein